MDKKIRFVVCYGMIVGPIYYAKRFIEYLETRSIDYYIVNTDDPSTYMSPSLDEFLKETGVVVFLINNIGLGLNVDGKNFWKCMNAPVIDYIVDHPRNFSDSMREPACDLYVFTLDRDHRDYINRFYPKVKEAIFSPNGGTAIGNGLDYEKRDIDVLYMGNCNRKIQGFPMMPELPEIKNVAAFYEDVINLMFQDPMLPTEKAIEKYFESHNIDLNDEKMFIFSTKYEGNIETYIRRFYKLEGIKALDDEGVRVDIYGTQWDDENYVFSDNIHVHNRIGIEELMNIIGHAKISLCFIPWFKNGCSEKNFDSMLNGALCVSDRSGYLEENYRDGDNIVYFDLNNPKQMAADIKWLLKNPDAAAKIAQRGYETAMAYDTWYKRYEKVVDYAYHIIDQK